MSSRDLDCAASERRSDQSPDVMRGHRAATGNAQMHEERTARGGGTPHKR